MEKQLIYVDLACQNVTICGMMRSIEEVLVKKEDVKLSFLSCNCYLLPSS